jgi:hypothetical protein
LEDGESMECWLPHLQCQLGALDVSRQTSPMLPKWRRRTGTCL